MSVPLRTERAERTLGVSFWAHLAYSCLLRLGLPAYLWRVWSRGRDEPDYRAHWWRRLGWYERAYRAALGTPRSPSPLIWVHAVSLGEARAAEPLVQALRRQHPGVRLLLTHTTATGMAAGRALLAPGDVQTWLPYDTPGAVRRFLRLHRPAVGVLMETEVWPNVQREAQRAEVPMVLANARLSEKSLRQGLRLSVLLRPAAQRLRLVMAQTQADADRLERMGAPHVQVIGNVKFDMTPPPALLARGQRWRQGSQRPIVLAASTREGEEAMLLAAWCGQGASAGPEAGPPARLWIVPRHPQRFDEVAQLVLARGLSLSRRSQWVGDEPDAQAHGADVWLGDTMGEMPAYYAAAAVALLGGSFAPLGGQNLIEAAACGCPVVMGPSTFNFSRAAQMSEAQGAAIRVNDMLEGVTRARAGCEHGQWSRMASAALAFAGSQQGAADRMAAQVLQCRLTG